MRQFFVGFSLWEKTASSGKVAKEEGPQVNGIMCSRGGFPGRSFSFDGTEGVLLSRKLRGQKTQCLKSSASLIFLTVFECPWLLVVVAGACRRPSGEACNASSDSSHWCGDSPWETLSWTENRLEGGAPSLACLAAVFAISCASWRKLVWSAAGRVFLPLREPMGQSGTAHWK